MVWKLIWLSNAFPKIFALESRHWQFHNIMYGHLVHKWIQATVHIIQLSSQPISFVYTKCTRGSWLTHPVTSVCTPHVGAKNNQLQWYYERVKANSKDSYCCYWIWLVTCLYTKGYQQLNNGYNSKQRKSIHLQYLTYLSEFNLSYCVSSGSGSNLQQWEEGHHPLMGLFFSQNLSQNPFPLD